MSLRKHRISGRQEVLSYEQDEVYEHEGYLLKEEILMTSHMALDLPRGENDMLVRTSMRRTTKVIESVGRQRS